MTKPLRPYQLEAVGRVIQQWRGGRRRVCFVLPTGGGKTRTGGAFVEKSVDQGAPVLWLAQRTELIDQAANALRELELPVGVVSASSKEPENLLAPVQVASIDTLLARNIRPRAKLVVFDECHGAAADTRSALLEAYPEALVLGLTATPQRGDGRALSGQFDSLVVGATVSQLTDLGVLVPAKTICPDARLGARELAQHPVDAYFDHALGTQAILFARDIHQAEEYADAFRQRGIEARCVHADRPWAERDLYVDAFKAGKIRVLCNVFCLVEGFDHPPLETVIVARGCSSAGMWIQMIGRALRSSPGKERALILDLPGIAHDFGEAEDERLFSLDGDGIRLRDKVPYCPVCGAIRQAGEDCISCGWSAEHSMQPADVIKRRKLAAFVRRQNDDDEARANALAYMIQVGREKGWKPGAAMHRFAGRYGERPTQAVITRAHQLAAMRSKGAA